MVTGKNAEYTNTYVFRSSVVNLKSVEEYRLKNMC